MHKQNDPSSSRADAPKKTNRGHKKCEAGCKCGRHNRAKRGDTEVVAQTRTRFRQQQFIQALIASGGIHQPALDELGIQRCTLRDWRKKFPDFVQEMDDVKAMQVDFVRSKMMKAITNGSERLIEFYLSRVDPEFAKQLDALPPDEKTPIAPNVVFIPASKQTPDE